MSEAPEFAPESQDQGEVELPGEQQVEPQTTEPTAPDKGSQPETPADNPAWKDVLDLTHEHFRDQMKGHLSKFDKTLQEAQQRAAAWKDFTENNISPDIARQGIDLIQLFNSNPRAVWDFLNQQYNYLGQVQPQQQNQSQDQQQESVELGEDNQQDIFKDPRVQQMANQAAFAQQAVQQMQEQAIAQQAQVKAETELAQLAAHAEYKNIPQQVVIQTALGMATAASARTGREVEADLMAAAKYLWDSGAYRAASRPAPPHLSGGRGTTSPQETDPLKDIAKMSRNQRNALVAEMMKQADGAD